MSPIAFALDLLLVSLLMLAVWIGVRLERRLKGLRDSQAGFVNAVAELNDGVAKAQSGLADLKAATLEGSTVLADRIQDAKGMIARLERQIAAADAAAGRLDAAVERANSARPAPASYAPQYSAHPGEGRDPGVLSLNNRDRASPLRREALAHAVEKSLGPGLRRDERVVARPRLDEDLFEVIEPVLRAARGIQR